MNTSRQAAAQGPRYLRIREQLVEMIVERKLRGGDLLPSEGQLARHFGVALGTLRKAVDELVARNVMARVQGKGLFVAAYDTDAAMRLFRVLGEDGTKELPRFGRLLGLRTRLPTANERLRLALDREAKVIQLKRARVFADDSVMLETICLPCALFPDFKQRLGDERPALLYDFYERQWDVHVVSASTRLRAVNANAEEARQMKLREGDAVLSIERVAFTLHDVPVELRSTLCDTSKGRHYFDE